MTEINWKMIAFCKSYCKHVPKYIENWCPNPLKFIKNPSQINENGAQERFGGALGRNRKAGASISASGWYFLEAFWHHLGDFCRFCGPLKIRGGAKSDPKNSIRRLVGALWRPTGGKKRFWKAFGTSMKFWSKIDAKMGGFGAQNHWFFIGFIRFSCFWRFSKKYDFLMKKGCQNEAKIDTRIIRNRFWAAKGAKHVDFDSFWVVFWGMRFFNDFWAVQKTTKNDKSSALGRLKRKSGTNFGRVGE